MSVGRRIALKRNEKGLTQTELANLLGLKSASISQYEAGDRNPSYEKLIKIANILDTSLDFLLIGDEETSGFPDHITKKITLALSSFSESEKKDLFAVMQRLAGIKYQPPFSMPEKLLSSPEDYAEYILNKLGFDSFPIDPFQIAEKLKVRIINSTQIPESFGELIKGCGCPTIILDQDQHPSKKRFTIAMLIGHLIMPWHLRTHFYREKNVQSSNVTDPLGIEARRFAAALLTPKHLLQPELNELVQKVGCIIPLLEEMAERFRISIFTLAVSLAEYFPENYVVINTKDFNVTGKFVFNYLSLVDTISDGTKAHELLLNLPKEKTIVSGLVPQRKWFINGHSDKTVLEEVIYNPEEIKGAPQFLILLKIL